MTSAAIDPFTSCRGKKKKKMRASAFLSRLNIYNRSTDLPKCLPTSPYMFMCGFLGDVVGVRTMCKDDCLLPAYLFKSASKR